ncbi:hypothetical protein WMY93_017556 [Mugilogobius chulae]|uniref:Gamma-glutamylcyclotransferase n=1 Tax=Mugilogobius chulae TaxID=88201 RepID=A0AAW0NT09_9GOBI
MKPQDILKEKSSLWIFGYGSLVWKPNFVYKEATLDISKDTKDASGMEMTSTEETRKIVSAVLTGKHVGVAYEVTGPQIEESLQYLNIREVMMGGYITEVMEFTPRESDQSSHLALVYIATPDNPIYLGPASDTEIAAQIATCQGSTGLNLEYLVRLAEFMRLYCPEVEDHHLFAIEEHALNLVRRGTESPMQRSVLVGAK